MLIKNPELDELGSITYVIMFSLLACKVPLLLEILIREVVSYGILKSNLSVKVTHSLQIDWKKKNERGVCTSSLYIFIFLSVTIFFLAFKCLYIYNLVILAENVNLQYNPQKKRHRFQSV